MNELSGQRPTWAEIDLDALAFNFRSVKKFVGSEIEQMAVVKANAYGHGAVPCARRLEAEGADWFAVATVEEGIELRQAAITKPILILGGFWPGQELQVLNHTLTPVIYRIDQAEAIASASKHEPAIAHIKIDTGMGRVGFRWDAVGEVADLLAAIPNLKIDGLMTHFAVADKLDESDFTNEQISRFADVVEVFHGRGFRPRYLDLANSPGAVVHPLSRSTLVRIGGLLYGLGGDVIPKGVDRPELKPVMSVKTKIAMIKRVPAGEAIGYGLTYRAERDSLIATIPIGYHDGVPRSLSNKGQVIINGKFAWIAGRVSMDWITIDVTDIDSAEVGSVVTLIGSDGDSTVLAEDIAGLTNTISYEITCGIGSRVPRIFVGE